MQKYPKAHALRKKNFAEFNLIVSFTSKQLNQRPMKKSILVLFLLVLSITAQAQFRLVTNPPLQGGNGSAGVTFNLRSNISIYVDTIWVALYGTGPCTI